MRGRPIWPFPSELGRNENNSFSNRATFMNLRFAEYFLVADRQQPPKPFMDNAVTAQNLTLDSFLAQNGPNKGNEDSYLRRDPKLKHDSFFVVFGSFLKTTAAFRVISSSTLTPKSA
jgi:hypothetical protein